MGFLRDKRIGLFLEYLGWKPGVGNQVLITESPGSPASVSFRFRGLELMCHPPPTKQLNLNASELFCVCEKNRKHFL